VFLLILGEDVAERSVVGGRRLALEGWIYWIRMLHGWEKETV
jgi:hypothetical protein